MKNSLLFYFIAFYLISSIGLKDLTKINVFPNHFQETKWQVNALPLLKLTINQYATVVKSDHVDMIFQLPIKIAEIYGEDTFPDFIPIQISDLALKSLAPNENNMLPSRVFSKITNYHAFIWHPPQLS